MTRKHRKDDLPAFRRGVGAQLIDRRREEASHPLVLEKIVDALWRRKPDPGELTLGVRDERVDATPQEGSQARRSRFVRIERAPSIAD